MSANEPGLRADIVWEANTGQAIRDLGQVGEQYARTTGQMTDDALKMSAAQDHLTKTIARSGPESEAAKKATLAYRRELQAITAASTRAAAADEKKVLTSREVAVSSREAQIALLSEERALGRFSRGALAAAGVSSELKRALLLGSGSFLIGAGVAALVKSSLEAAKGEEVAQAQLKVALADTGNEWGRYGSRIEESLAAQIKATGFTKTELTSSLGQFVRRFGDVDQALRANAIAADVARAKNIGLADAQTLIMRASFGNPRSLRILGIELNKTTTNYDALRASTRHASKEQVAAAKAADLQANELSALDQVQAKYHGNAAKYLTTSAGKQALFNAELEHSKEIIGGALLPTFNRLITGLSTYLDRMNRSGQLQRDVNKIVKDGGDVVHGLEAAFHAFELILLPINSILGGTKHTVEALTAAFVALKVRGLLGVGAAAKTTEREVVAAGTAAETEVAALRTGLLGLSALSPVVTITLAIAGAAALDKYLNWAKTGLPGQPGPDTSRPLDKNGNPPLSTWTDWEKAAFAVQHGTKTADYYMKHPAEEMRVIRQGLAADTPHGAGTVNRTAGFGGTAKRDGRAAPVIVGLTEAQSTALYRAEGSPSTTDDLSALQAQLVTYNKLLAQRNLTPAQLNQLLQGRNSVTSQISSINQANAAAEAGRKSKAEAARKKLAAEAAKKRKATLSRLEQAPVELRIAEQTARANGASETKLLAILREERAAIDKQVAELKKIGAGKDAILKARTNEAAIQSKIDTITKKKKAAAGTNEAEFLSSFQQIIGAYAPNAFPVGPGKTNTHLHDLVHETRRSNGYLADLAARSGFPATGYAIRSADAVAG